jgi:peroxiredoxin
MYDFERSLVNKFKSRPFVLIGVNSDDPPARLSEIIKDRNLTWNSWADGRGGPIARAWQVHGYPTIYLIDHKGTIRAVFNDESDLEKTVEDLVKEAERK